MTLTTYISNTIEETRTKLRALNLFLDEVEMLSTTERGTDREFVESEVARLYLVHDSIDTAYIDRECDPTEKEVGQALTAADQSAAGLFSNRRLGGVI